MTVDRDDVELARDWLKKRDRWGEDGLVKEYEAAFASWNGSRRAFAFMSGRVALRACLEALGIGAADEVLLPGYTCVAVPDAIQDAGAVPVYGDIELETYGLDAAKAEARVGPHTRALLIQHLYGLVCRDYEATLDLAERHGLSVIEDCAHATGACYRGRKVGTRGDVGFFSSEQSKVFSTVRGGVAVTDDGSLAERLAAYSESAPRPDADWIDRQLKTQIFNYHRFKHRQRRWRGRLVGMRYGDALLPSGDDEVQRFGAEGSRMAAPIAALGLNQLGKLDRYNDRRRASAERWTQWCEEAGYDPPVVVPESTPVFLRFPVLVEPERKRDTSWAVRRLGVRPGVWFLTHVHPRPERVEGCPTAGQAVERCINLPCLLDDR